MKAPIKIFADYREIRSGLPDILKKRGASIKSGQLKTGDYLVNNKVLIERKTGEDFVLSLIQNRLFEQCSRLKKTGITALLLLEGNPFSTQHRISRQAVKGALVSLAVSWELPLLFAKDINDSAEIILTTANQMKAFRYPVLYRSRKTRTMQGRKFFFLQGLPGVGPITAAGLVNKFGTIKHILQASEEELRQVEGIGEAKARAIRFFLENH